MGADILVSFGTIQDELDKAKSNLKGLNDNIRRIVGRDPSDATQLRLGWFFFSNAEQRIIYMYSADCRKLYSF